MTEYTPAPTGGPLSISTDDGHEWTRAEAEAIRTVVDARNEGYACALGYHRNCVTQATVAGCGCACHGGVAGGGR